MNLLAATSWESLLALLIFISLSALSTGLTKKRREKGAEAHEMAGPLAATSPSPLLEEEREKTGVSARSIDSVAVRHPLRSRERARAVPLLRDRKTVRQAFIASLVFGSPKAFET